VVPRATKINKEKRRDAVNALASGEVEQRRNYELVLVLDPGATEEKLETIINGINQNVTALGGEISGTEQWGRRKLAYPIKGVTEGYYVLSRFVLNPTQSNVLETKLRISEDITRHMLIKTGNC
jgi:small subunit ribosomal protein S6